MKLLIPLILPLLLFAEFDPTEIDDDLAEIEALAQEYEQYADEQKEEFQAYKDKRTPNFVKDDIPEERYVETSEKVYGNSPNVERTNSNRASSYQKSNFGISEKPDFSKTKEILTSDRVLQNPNIADSEQMLYIQRWFQLVNQVTQKDESSIFYLLKDSHFNLKLADIEELSVDENFIPDDKLISIIRDEHQKWIDYLSILVDDFGDIDDRFYNNLSFRVIPKVGLNLRDNPLTGTDMLRKTKLKSSSQISMKYFILGSGKFFNGKFSEKWAKIIVTNRNGQKNIGWVSMRYLGKR